MYHVLLTRLWCFFFSCLCVCFFDASECKSVKPHCWQSRHSMFLKIWFPYLDIPLKNLNFLTAVLKSVCLSFTCLYNCFDFLIITTAFYWPLVGFVTQKKKIVMYESVARSLLLLSVSINVGVNVEWIFPILVAVRMWTWTLIYEVHSFLVIN